MINSFDLASRINSDVNGRVSYRFDKDLYGTPEFWEPAQSLGDCEDYALEKRRLLLEAGWPQDAMGLIFCRINSNGHCCLWVLTDRGSYILDNNYMDPMQPDMLPYQWESMLCAGQWRQLSGWQ